MVVLIQPGYAMKCKASDHNMNPSLSGLCFLLRSNLYTGQILSWYALIHTFQLEENWNVSYYLLNSHGLSSQNVPTTCLVFPLVVSRIFQDPLTGVIAWFCCVSPVPVLCLPSAPIGWSLWQTEMDCPNPLSVKHLLFLCKKSLQDLLWLPRTGATLFHIK